MGATLSSRLNFWNIRQDDFVILVVGPSGAGKTTFINTAVGKNPPTPPPKPGIPDVGRVVCSISSELGNQRIVFVDAPAFDSCDDDESVPVKLREWFHKISSKNLNISSIFYLHSVADKRVAGFPAHHLTTLSNLFIQSGHAFPDCVALITTMWTAVEYPHLGLEREVELGSYLNVLPHGGVVPRIFRFEDTFESAWSIVRTLLYSSKNPAPAMASLRMPDGGLMELPPIKRLPAVTSPLDASSQQASSPSHVVPFTLPQDVPFPISPTKGSAKINGQVRALVMKIGRHANQQSLIAKLTEEDAQCMVDFLNIMLHERGFFATEDGTFILSLVCNIANARLVIPRSYKLTGVEIESDPREGGSFFDYYKGQYKNKTLSLKIIRLFGEGHTMRLLRDNIEAFTIWFHLSHSNLLPFYGIFRHGSQVNRFCLVSPWMKNGNLHNYLKFFPQQPRLPLISDVTNGLLYLHDLKIIHGDLKAQNILISDNNHALIAEFNVFHVEIDAQIASTSLPASSLRWKAPELFARHVFPSLESDIWSFGCLCYEVFTRKVPFYQYENDMTFAMGLLGQEIPTRPVPEDECDKVDERVWDIMIQCWNFTPSKRPTCSELRTAILDLHIVDDRPKAEPHAEDVHAFWETMRVLSDSQIDLERIHGILLSISDDSIYS